MLPKPPPKKNKDGNIIDRVIGTASEEVEKVGQSIGSQVTGEVASEEPNPIVEAMKLSSDDDPELQNKLNKQKKFIRTREELDKELEEVRRKRQEQEKAWSESVDQQFKIVDPGGNMQEEPAIPLTSKPKRGQMPGKPGTAKGETGMEVRKSKQ